jgi:ribosomal protein S27AE
MAKPNLPIEAHDGFRKANVFHADCVKDAASLVKNALEAGKELLEAKRHTPHGRWEAECERLFDGSVRTAQFYMQFATHMKALTKAQSSAVLFLEHSIEGATKVAKRLAKGEAPYEEKPTPDEPIEAEYEVVEETETVEESGPETPSTPGDCAGVDAGSDKPTERCPNCAAVKWQADEDGWYCGKCNHPYGEPAGDVDEDRITTQRQKTVKTAEALMRAFDDLQLLMPKPTLHASCIAETKTLLKAAKGWK